MKNLYLIGSGPIVSRLAYSDALSVQFNKVIVFTDNRKNIFDPKHYLEKSKQVQVLPLSQIEITKFGSEDFVILAWRSLVALDPLKFHILKFLSHHKKIFNIIYLSSVSVYGNQVSPANEYCILRPINEYGFIKAQSEVILSELFGDNAISLRLSNIYGDFNFDDVVNRIGKSLRFKNRLTLFSPDKISRDFLHISELESIVSQLIVHLRDYEPRFSKLNIACGQSVYVKDILNDIKLETNITINYELSEAPPNVVLQSNIDINLLTSVIHKSPKIMPVWDHIKLYL